MHNTHVLVFGFVAHGLRHMNRFNIESFIIKTQFNAQIKEFIKMVFVARRIDKEHIACHDEIDTLRNIVKKTRNNSVKATRCLQGVE